MSGILVKIFIYSYAKGIEIFLDSYNVRFINKQEHFGIKEVISSHEVVGSWGLG